MKKNQDMINKKYIRSLMALMLVFILVLSFVACGSTEEDSGADENKVSQFGWTEDDIKPDGIFKDMRYEDSKGYFISITEPIGEEGYVAWYNKLFDKTEELADDGSFTVENVTDVDLFLQQTIRNFKNGYNTLYLSWDYTCDGKKINIITMVSNLEATEEALYFYIREREE